MGRVIVASRRIVWKITAYVICSFLAGVPGLLFAYELDSGSTGADR